ncbi:hypothetical protein ACLOJK_021830 [Asimina triloba]
MATDMVTKEELAGLLVSWQGASFTERSVVEASYSKIGRMSSTRSHDDRLNRLEQDVGMILQLTTDYRQEEQIGRIEPEGAERAMAWDRRFDGLHQQRLGVREGMYFILSKINTLREKRSSLTIPPGFGVPEGFR